MVRHPFGIVSPFGLVSPFGSAASGGSLFATDWDGTNDFASWPTVPTGLVDGPAFTFSLFFQTTKSSGRSGLFDWGNGFLTRLEPGGNATTTWVDTAGGFPLPSQTFGGNVFNNGDVHHLIMTGDRTSGRRQIVIDRTTVIRNDTGYATANDLDLNGGTWQFFKQSTDFFDGIAFELWWDARSYDVVTNIGDWINADGTPADMGADGSGPGAQPIIYAPDGNPETNLGTGGNATVTGSPATVARPV